MFSLLAGLERPTHGRILLNERILTDVDEGIHVAVQKRRIGVVFQDRLLFPHLSVRENLRFGERYASGKTVLLEEVIDWLDLEPMLDSMPQKPV